MSGKELKKAGVKSRGRVCLESERRLFREVNLVPVWLNRALR